MALAEPASALAVDASGFAYVASQSDRMHVYSSGGILQRAFVLPNLSAPVGAISIDVTANGCTLVYVGDHSSADRFDTCAPMVLALLAPGERFDAVRALSDGRFVGAPAGQIKSHDSTGRVMYDVLAPHGQPCRRRLLLRHQPPVDVDRQRRVPGQNEPHRPIDLGADPDLRSSCRRCLRRTPAQQRHVTAASLAEVA